MSDQAREPDMACWSPGETSGWYDARNAVTGLRDVLVAAGLTKHFPYLRAEVSAFGQGIVELGRTTPEAASRIAELVALGLTVDPRAAADSAREGSV